MLQRLEHEKYLRLEAIKAVEEEKTRRDALVAKVAQQRANLTQLEVSTLGCLLVLKQFQYYDTLSVSSECHRRATGQLRPSSCTNAWEKD